MAGYLSFDRLITKTFVKVIYFIGFIVLTISAIAFLVWSGMRLHDANIDRNLGWRYVAIGAVSLVIGNIAWRLICEFWIVLFSINDGLMMRNQEVTVRSIQRVPETQIVERRAPARERRLADVKESLGMDSAQSHEELTGHHQASVLGLS
jgi:hypothetical protein